MAEKLMREDGTLYQTMLKVGGESFRCRCGCNVFHHPDANDRDRYECNSCGEHYTARHTQAPEKS